MIERCTEEFQKVVGFFDQSLNEYKGSKYLEDESIVGSSEKVIFFAKEMIAHLTLTPKSALDPYQICKLDVNTISFFDFPKVRKPDGKYLMQRQQGTTASKWLIECTRKSMIEIAKKKKSIKAV